MNDNEVDLFCAEVGDVLVDKGILIIYGPFKFNSLFTSVSNSKFDLELRSRGQGSSIKDFENISSQLQTHGFVFEEKIDLPSNSHCLIFKKCSLSC